EEEPLLVVGVYRSDEIARGHPLRRLRRDLRRSGRLRELVLEPLDSGATALLAAQTLGAEPSPALAAVLYQRTQGVPFFVEELAAALVSGGRVRAGRRGIELVKGEDVPLPDTVRDAVLLRTAALSDEARATHEYAEAAPVLVTAAGEYARARAYRDALRTGRRAVELWAEGEDEAERLTLLAEIGRCAQLCGELPEAIIAWREVADARRAAGDALGLAAAERELATAYELQGL